MVRTPRIYQSPPLACQWHIHELYTNISDMIVHTQFTLWTSQLAEDVAGSHALYAIVLLGRARLISAARGACLFIGILFGCQTLATQSVDSVHTEQPGRRKSASWKQRNRARALHLFSALLFECSFGGRWPNWAVETLLLQSGKLRSKCTVSVGLSEGLANCRSRSRTSQRSGQLSVRWIISIISSCVQGDKNISSVDLSSLTSFYWPP